MTGNIQPVEGAASENSACINDARGAAGTVSARPAHARRATLSDQTFEGRRENLNQANKFGLLVGSNRGSIRPRLEMQVLI
jgi:hypothetical protein